MHTGNDFTTTLQEWYRKALVKQPPSNKRPLWISTPFKISTHPRGSKVL